MAPNNAGGVQYWPRAEKRSNITPIGSQLPHVRPELSSSGNSGDSELINLHAQAAFPKVSAKLRQDFQRFSGRCSVDGKITVVEREYMLDSFAFRQMHE